MSKQRIRALLDHTPADAAMLERLVKLAEGWRSAGNIEKAVDKAVALAYKAGWHQGWQDCPPDEF